MKKICLPNGYYLSVYAHISDIAYLYDIQIRHNQNMALWKKNDDKVELIRYYDFERWSGLKEHALSFYDVEHAKRIINTLLSEDGISLDDITEIWGTPLLDKGETYFSENDYRKLTYHSICHLFSGLLYDTANFYADSIIALAVDGGPDYVVDVDMTKKSYAGSLSRSGEILDVFPVYSPGMLWAEASKYFKLKEGTLMALASASSSTLWEDNYELPLYDSRPFNVEAYNFIDNIYKKVEKLSDADKGVLFSGYDDQFSIEDNNTSVLTC